MSDIFNLKEIHEDMDNETLVNNTEVLLIACYKIFITTIDDPRCPFYGSRSDQAITHRDQTTQARYNWYVKKISSSTTRSS